MGKTTLVIVGGGPSCTYVMERLAATAGGSAPDTELEIHIFDRSGQFGAGQVHSPIQPRSSVLNRIVGQVAFAADESVTDAGPLLDRALRPTLHEWCAAKLRETGLPDFALGPQDWPKRYVHGLALREQFDLYAELLRAADVRVRLHADEVTDLEESGAGLIVTTSRGGEPVIADQVLLLTGHSSNGPRPSSREAGWANFAAAHPAVFLSCAYPLEEFLTDEVVGPGETVACAGMGLTAIDVVLHLTEGRGGVFKEDAEGRLVYQPSGREPAALALFGSTGLFTYARPHNAKERDPASLEHRGVFLTEQAIDRLRTVAGTPVRIGGTIRRQLDFERHVMPLVILEMAYVHYRTLLGAPFAAACRSAADEQYQAHLSDGGDGQSVRRLLAPVDRLVDRAEEIIGTARGRATAEEPWAESAARRYREVVHGPRDTRHSPRFAGNRFSWEGLITPLPVGVYPSPAAYTEALLDFMDVDHRWAAQDNVTNPAKAAADGVWRDLRPVLAYAVDFGGLTAASHRTFLSTYLRHHNRLCNGAALEVMEKMRALVGNGIVDASFGPDATAVADSGSGFFRVVGPHTGAVRLASVLVDARVHQFDAGADVRPLYPNLLRRGLVRKWRNPGVDGPDFEPGGLDLTPDFHPVRGDGRVETRLTILGPPSEGVMFFQLGALRPGQNHHVMRDVLCWVRHFWKTVAGRGQGQSS